VKRRRWLWGLGIFAVAGVADYWAFPPLAKPGGRIVDRRENALWLRYTWYFGEREDFQGLAKRLTENGIRDAYFHVRSIETDGSLKYRKLASARRLNEEVGREAPGVRRIAWIYAGNPQGLGNVDLTREAVRRRMVEEAAWLVREAGFDGVQWDYEICPDGDRGLLNLLEETRKALPKGTFLGAAVPTWYPAPLGGFGWSEAYFREVAQRCDGMAVMAYDSAAYTPRLYVWWVSEQVVRSTRAASGTGCRVVMGVPTYGNGTPSHNPHAENLRLALMGVRGGLAGGAVLSAWQGVGIFADYTTDESEWKSFKALWSR
jgi:hypothetical protein